MLEELDTDYIIPHADLVVGDLIVALVGVRSHAGSRDPFQYEMVVCDLNPLTTKYVNGDGVASFRDRSNLRLGNRFVWIRQRNTAAAAKTTNSSKRISEFPHVCIRCGAAAYIGLFSITHENNTTTCPARGD